MPGKSIVSVQRDVNEVRNQMMNAAHQYADALPEGGMKFQKLMRSVLLACNHNTYLLECDRGSLLAAGMSAATVGLEINPVLGHGYLVPFKGKVQFLPGYGGYGLVASNSLYQLSSNVVCEADEFDFELGTKPFIHHKPDKQERGSVTHAYAVVRSNYYPTMIQVMNLQEICRIRDRSAGYQNAIRKGKETNPWQTDFPAMARKTPYRAIAKQVPLRVVHLLAGLEEQHDLGHVAHINRNQDIVTDEMRAQTDVVIS